VINLLIIFLMVLCNAILAAYEIALTSISRPHLDFLAQENQYGARKALALKKDISATLSTIQLGISLCGMIAGALGGLEAGHLLASWLEAIGLPAALAQTIAVGTIVLLLSFLTITFAELIPKYFAIQHNEYVALRLSRMMEKLVWFSRPVNQLLSSIVERINLLIEQLWHPPKLSKRGEALAMIQELRALTNYSHLNQVLGAQEKHIILAATKLANTPVSSILLHPNEITVLDSRLNVEKLVDIVHETSNKRYPISPNPDDLQQVAGYIAARELFYLHRVSPTASNAKSIIREVQRVRANLPLSSLMEKMIRERAHLLLVENAQKIVIGMVTLEDLLEELVGDIENEFDTLPNYVINRGDGLLVGGGVNWGQLINNADFPSSTVFSIDETRHWTVQEVLTNKLGHTPKLAESIEIGDISIVINKVRRGKVVEALITQTQTKS